MTSPETAAPPAARPSPRPAGNPPAPGLRLTGTDALLATMSLIWGINLIVAKAAFTVLTPAQFNAARFLLAAVVVSLVARRYGSGRPDRSDWGRLAFLGLLGNTAYQVAFVEGLNNTRAGNASLILAGGPIVTAMLSHLHGHERLRARDLAGLAVSTAGVAVIVLGSGAEIGFRATIGGDLLILVATVCWAAYTVGSKPLVDRYGPVTSTAWTMVIGAVPLVLLGGPSLLGRGVTSVAPAAWGAVLYSSLGALVLAFLLWYRGVERLGATRTATFSNFTPVIAILVAWPALHEVPTLWQGIGAAGIFSGIYLART